MSSSLSALMYRQPSGIIEQIFFGQD